MAVGYTSNSWCEWYLSKFEEGGNVTEQHPAHTLSRHQL